MHLLNLRKQKLIQFLTTLRKQYKIISFIGIIIIIIIIKTLIGGNKTTDSQIVYTGDPITAEIGNLVQTLNFDGTTSYADSQKLTFGQQGLKVSNVFVQVSDSVKKDQILATLESSDLDANFNSAQNNLSLAQLNYNKVLTLQDKDGDLLKAQNILIQAQANLDSIEASIQIANATEDNDIAKAEQALKDAKEDYEDLVCNDCANSNEKIRNQRNTYKLAIEDLRSIINNAQSTIDSIDNIMYFSNKYQNTIGSKEFSAYIGHNDPSTITNTRKVFNNTTTIINELEDIYIILSNKDINSIVLNEIREAYNKVDKLSQSIIDLGNNSRSMFNASLVGWGLAGQGANIDQSTVDGYINLANNIYNNGKSMNIQGSTTMEKIYNLDNNSTESNINKAKQSLDVAQLNLNKLLLNKSNRITNNQNMRTVAITAVTSAQRQLEATQNNIYDTSVQQAYNQVVQAQSSFNQTRKRYESYQLIANFNGTVTEMNIQVGDNVDTNSNTYIYVENPNLIETEISVDQTDIVKLSQGDDVTVTLDVYPNQSFSGIISEINTVPMITNGKANYTVKVISEKPEYMKILGGMSANISYTQTMKSNILIVPSPAILFSGGQYYVMDTTKQLLQIKIGDSDGSHTEIISGIKPGQQIISRIITSNNLDNSGIQPITFEQGDEPPFGDNNMRQGNGNNPDGGGSPQRGGSGR